MSKGLSKESLKVEELLPEINANHRECMKSGRESAKHAVEAGQLLLKLKECLKHGEFEATVEKRCDFAVRTAQAYMKLAGGMPLLEKQGKQVGVDATISGCLKLITDSKKSEKPKAQTVRFSPKSGASSKKPPSQSDAPTTPAEDAPVQTAMARAVEQALEEAEPEKELSFEDRVKAENKAIEGYCKSLEAFFTDTRPKVMSVTDARFDSAMAAIRSACNTIRTCKYHKQPCPRCKGDGCKTCEQESDFGAVTSLTYQQIAR